MFHTAKILINLVFRKLNGSLTLDYPELVNRLILLGTGPRGGEGMETYTPEVWAMFAKQYEFADELNLDTLFAPSAGCKKVACH